MSTDQPTLTESIDRQAERTRQRAAQALEDRGAAYGRGVEATAAAPPAEPHCRGCERPLAEVAQSPQRARELARVVGDNDGCVPGCPECVETRYEGHEVATITTAAEMARDRGE